MDIMQLAKQRAAAYQYMETLGQANACGRTLEESIAARAAYKLAQDAAERADAEYRNAILGMSSAELLALAQAK